jgi:hypothetical protein
MDFWTMVDFNTHLDSKITSLQELTVGQLARAPWWEPAGRGSSPGTYIAFKEGRGPVALFLKKNHIAHLDFKDICIDSRL